MKRFAILLACLVVGVLKADQWHNIDEESKLGGRKLSEGYLLGKTVLVCKDRSMAGSMQSIWESFRTKPFILIGAFDSVPEGVTFPVYRGAGIEFAPAAPIYVVNAAGRVVYKGNDDRYATQAVVMALTDQISPKNGLQMRMFLDHELAFLPAHAYLRFADLKKRFPAVAQMYAAKEKELKAMAYIQEVAELVTFAAKAKDPKIFGAKEKGKQAQYVRLVKKAANDPKYLSLKEKVTEERLLQEVKNSIADIKFTAAEL